MNWPVDIDTIENPDMRALLLVLQSMFAELQGTIEGLRQDLARKDEENAQLKRLLFGQKSERKARVPSPKAQLKSAKTLTEEEKAEKKRATQEKRKKNREARRKKLPVVEKVIKIPTESLVCPQCGGHDFAPYINEVTERIEHVPEHLVRYKIIRERMSCRCGQCILTAPAPPTVTEGALYGPGLHAHVVVAKCLDAMPLNRQAKSLCRAGADINTSTLGELFHRVAEACRPIYQRMLDKVAVSEYVSSDETKLPVKAKGKCFKSSMWTFISGTLVCFVYSRSSGKSTPEEILKKSSGILQADGHACYNTVCEPKGQRKRAGCWSHVRRKFFDAQKTSPEESQHAIAEILALYEVEYRAIDLDIFGSAKHLLLRQLESRAITDRFHKWLKEQHPLHPPKSPLGKAIQYALNQWVPLISFLEDTKIRLDNNKSERALRVIAQGRKNFLFVGNDQAGENLAILQTIVASCQASDVNPYNYLRDILIRVHTHPSKRIDEILPDRWVPPDREDLLRPKTSA